MLTYGKDDNWRAINPAGHMRCKLSQADRHRLPFRYPAQPPRTLHSTYRSKRLCYSRVALVKAVLARSARRGRASNPPPASSSATPATLTHVDRLMMTGQMVGAIAHELKQPLGAIDAYVEACRQTLLSSGSIPQVMGLLTKIGGLLAYSNAVIAKIRRLSHSQAPKRTYVDIYSIVDNTLAVLDGSLREAGVAMHVSRKPLLPAVYADSIMIEQVLMNLINNSIESLQQINQRRGRIAIDIALLDKQFLEITVTDNGAGISEPRADKLFAPFYTTKAHGLGVGLPLCSMIVESHGGRLWYETAKAVGATFKFTLPVRAHGRDKGVSHDIYS